MSKYGLEGEVAVEVSAAVVAVKHVDFTWEEFEKLGRLIESQKYTFARTMADNPHWYTLRKKWADPEHEWIWTVERIRAWGYKQKYGNAWYTCLDINEHFYWTMGLPIGSIEVEGWDWLDVHGTTLINRKIGSGNPEARVQYDAIAEACGYLLWRRLWRCITSCSTRSGRCAAGQFLKSVAGRACR